MIEVDTGSVKMTILGLRNTAVTGGKAAKAAVIAAGGVGLAGIRANMSYTDHAQPALTAMGSPYARRHGSIQVHAKKPWIVHDQGGGSLVNNLRGSYIKTFRGHAYDLAVTGTIAGYVIKGTSVMLPRDTLTQTLAEKSVRVAMMKAMVKALGQGLRSQAAVRFG
jgi:hypothetical protein